MGSLKRSENREIALVVPTIREDRIRDFIERWSAIGLFNWVDLILIEDNPERTFSFVSGAGSLIHHVSWKEIDADLGNCSWIIPRRSDTVRSYGYYEAWRAGYRYILTLDDDCYPCTEQDGVKYDGLGFLQAHVNQLEHRTRWFNTLNSVKPRGIPYGNLGKLGGVVVNHGLWTNVIDYDAPTQLVNPGKESFSFDSRLIPRGVYFPMCGMNVMWKREATPLMYHLLMGRIRWEGGTGVPNLRMLPFDRFGDIWCGIFMKKICDHLGWSVSSGMPYIRHERASDPFKNLRKEANGIEVNEHLWEFIDELEFWSSEPLGCYHELADRIESYDRFPDHRNYFEELAEAMKIWAELFEEKKNG